MWGGFVLEFELVNNSTDPFLSPPPGVAAGRYKSTDTSTEWEISDVRLVGDQVSLDSALQNSYAEHVLSGKTLPLNYNTLITMQQSVSGGQITVNISRAVSRLKTLFFNFYGGDPAPGMSEYANDAAVLAANQSPAFAAKRNQIYFIIQCWERIALVKN